MNRVVVINGLISRYRYRSYLEIGSGTRKTINKVNIEFRVGVDPNNRSADFYMSSDNFFKQNNDIFDIIFIDGLHTAEQVYKDIHNAIKILSPSGTIVVHDCLPYSESYASPSEVSGGWSGTVYMGFVRAKRELTDMSCFTINTDHGLGIITRNPILRNIASDIVFDDFATFDKHKDALLQLVEYDEFKLLIS